MTAEVKTLLLTDIEGSTAHWERDHSVMGAAVARHDEIIAAAVARSSGELVKHKGEGDSTFSVFEDPGDAVVAALELQRAMTTEPWPTTEPLSVRVGIHTGPVESRDGDYYGRDVNRAARVRGLTAGATIVTTAATAQLASPKLPEGAHLVDLGEHALRGLLGTERLYAVKHAELPDPELVLGYLRRRADPIPTGLRTHAARTLVGRRVELATLEDGWSAARTGQAALALVSGEAGAGKTQLAAAFAANAGRAGARVLYGRCDEEAVRPYQPIAEALLGTFDGCSQSELAAFVEEVAADLALVVPEIARRVRVDGQPAGERFVVLQAIASVLAGLAADQPTVVVIDDLHWADALTLSSLRHLLRTHPSASLLLVATYRDTDVDSRPLPDWLVEVRREIPAIEIALQDLGRAEVAELLGPALADRLEAVWAASDGNPFFVTELRRALEDNGVGAVPRSVRESVGARVGRLPRVTQRFVHAAAVAGFEVDVREVAHAADVDAEEADIAVSRGVLAGVDDPGRVRFVHALVRHAVLEDLTPVARAGLHFRAATAIQEVHRDRLDDHASRLAHHYTNAGPDCDAPAYDWSMRAGRRDGELLAYEAAEQHYRVAGEIAEVVGDIRGRITAELELAEVLRRSGRPTAGNAIAQGATATATAIGATDLAGWGVVLTRFGQPLGVPGEAERVARIRDALPVASPWRAPIDVIHGGELIQQGEVDAGVDVLSTSVTRARDRGDWLALAMALTGMHLYVDRVGVGVDDILDALARVDERSVPSLRLSPLVLRVQTESLGIGQLATAGNVDAAREAAAGFIARYGDETGMVEANVPLFMMTDALLSGDLGEWRRRRDRFRASRELANEYAGHLMLAQTTAAWLGRRLGDSADRVAEQPASMFLTLPVLALALACAGRRDEAMAVLEECGEGDRIEKRALTVAGRADLFFLGEAAIEAADEETARRIARALESRSGQVAGWAGWCFWGAFDALLGALAATFGEFDRAVSLLEGALAFHESVGWQALNDMTRARLASSLRARGRAGDVARADALDAASRRGMADL